MIQLENNRMTLGEGKPFGRVEKDPSLHLEFKKDTHGKIYKG